MTKCIKCGVPAAFQNIHTDPWTCIECQPQLTNPPTPLQKPKTLDEVCDKPAGTFKEFVKAQDSLTALQNDIQRVSKKLALGQQVFMGDLENILSAAKQLSALQTENEGLKASLEASNSRMIELVCDRDTLKSTLEATRRENAKMREALNKVFDEVEPTGKHFCLDCFNVIQKALTPLTNSDNSKEDVK